MEICFLFFYFFIDVSALFFMGMENFFFLWVGYMFGTLLNEFMEIKVVFFCLFVIVDWDIFR